MRYVRVPLLVGEELVLDRAERSSAKLMQTPRWTPKSGHEWTPENRPPRLLTGVGDGGALAVGRSPTCAMFCSRSTNDRWSWSADWATIGVVALTRPPASLLGGWALDRRARSRSSARTLRKPPDHMVAGRSKDFHAEEAREPVRYGMRRRATTTSASSPDAMSARAAGSGTVVLGVPLTRIKSACSVMPSESFRPFAEM